MILALDIARICGWCAGEPGDRPTWGTWVLPSTAFFGQQAAAFADCLADAITVHNPSLVIMEAPLVLQAQTAQASCYQQFGLAYLTELICFRREVRLRQEQPNTVRKAVIGRGRGLSKPDIVAWCRTNGFSALTSHDAADAAVLWTYACAQLVQRAA